MNQSDYTAKVLNHVPVPIDGGQDVMAVDPATVLGITIYNDVRLTATGIEEVEGSGTFMVVFAESHIHTKDKLAVMELLMKSGLPLTGMTYLYGRRCG